MVKTVEKCFKCQKYTIHEKEVDQNHLPWICTECGVKVVTFPYKYTNGFGVAH